MHGSSLSIQMLEWPMILEANVNIKADCVLFGASCFRLARAYLFSQHLEMTREHITDWIFFFLNVCY